MGVISTTFVRRDLRSVSVQLGGEFVVVHPLDVGVSAGAVGPRVQRVDGAGSPSLLEKAEVRLPFSFASEAPVVRDQGAVAFP